jgi:hypothetical protein
MKKHTKNVWNALEDVAITTMYRAGKNYEKITADAGAMQKVPLEDRGAFQWMGILYGLGIISPRQLTVIKDKWLKPEHDDFQKSGYVVILQRSHGKP